MDGELHNIGFNEASYTDWCGSLQGSLVFGQDQDSTYVGDDGWITCYTTDWNVDIRNEITSDLSKNEIGYRYDCNNVPFNEIRYTNVGSGEIAWFTMDNDSQITMSGY
eukprot:UN23433